MADQRDIGEVEAEVLRFILLFAPPNMDEITADVAIVMVEETGARPDEIRSVVAEMVRLRHETADGYPRRVFLADLVAACKWQASHRRSTSGEKADADGLIAPDPADRPLDPAEIGKRAKAMVVRLRRSKWRYYGGDDGGPDES
jgi:hypothetical protein